MFLAKFRGKIRNKNQQGKILNTFTFARKGAQFKLLLRMMCSLKRLVPLKRNQVVFTRTQGKIL
jgi:hypothetical protein